MCHICGRQTLLAGYSHHIEGCAKLFLAREEQKPKKERRSLPMNPYENMGAGVGGKKSAAEMNELSQQAYNGTLSECAHCGRRFLPEKLLIHNKSCRADKPARGVNDSVNRRQPDPSPQQAQYQVKTGGSSTQHHQQHHQQQSHHQQQQHQLQQQQQQQHTSSHNEGGAIRPKSARRLSADKIVQQYQDSQSHAHDNTDMYAAPAMIPAEWSQCQGCGRTFNEIAFAKHIKICDKIFCTKRAAFDSKKHRLNGTEAAQFNGTKGGGRRGGAGRGGRGGGQKCQCAQYSGFIRRARTRKRKYQ